MLGNCSHQSVHSKLTETNSFQETVSIAGELQALMGTFKLNGDKGLGRGKAFIQFPLSFAPNSRNRPRKASSFRAATSTLQLSLIQKSKQELNMVYLLIIKGLKVRRLECLTYPLSTLFEAND